MSVESELSDRKRIFKVEVENLNGKDQYWIESTSNLISKDLIDEYKKDQDAKDKSQLRRKERR